MSTLLDGYLLPGGDFEYCSSPNCYAKGDICKDNIANLECQLDGWSYGVVSDNNLSYLYTEITAPPEYYSDYPRVCGMTNRFPTNNWAYFGWSWWNNGYTNNATSSISTQNCANDFGDCNFPRITKCKTDRAVTRIDPCALKIGKDKQDRCCKVTSGTPTPCESGSCSYTFQIIKKTYSIDYELVKPSYICGSDPSFPANTCHGLPYIFNNTTYATYPYCTPKSNCEPYPCNPDNLKIPSGCSEIGDEYQRMSLSSWGGYSSCGNGGYSQLDGGVGQQGSGSLGCNAQNPLGASLGLYSYPNGSYNGYGAIRWHYYPENCKSACDTCTDYNASDCGLACYTNGNYPWWFNGVDYLSYVGTDCCYENVPMPCPTTYIDYDENTKPWYCAGSYCTQDVIGGGVGHGPYLTKTDCEKACSDSSCSNTEGILIKGWCCDKTFTDQMDKDIATGCYEQKPSKDIHRPLLLCNNGDGDKAEFDKPATRCYYNRKFTKTYKEVQNYRQKIVACSSSIPDKAYFPLINCAGLMGTDGYASCIEYWSEVYTGNRQNYQYPPDADTNGTVSYTFHPEEIVSTTTVQLTSVFCNLIITHCETTLNPG
jgi:hypothetical protein